jgi:endonuclease III-like uncharacterized protein
MPQEELKVNQTPDDVWEDLVVSILSVNNYSLEHTHRFIVGLRKQGVCHPKNLIRWDLDEIGRRLKAAGYDRGSFMNNQFALRLSALGVMIESKGLETCSRIISGHDTKAIEDLLLPVNGIGPKVIANFRLLREIPET